MCTVSGSSLPTIHPDLVVKPFSANGEYVVKHRRLGTYHRLGEFEYFLLLQLDGNKSGREVRAAFAQQFAEPLSREELNDFITLVGKQGLLANSQAEATPANAGDDDEDVTTPTGKKSQHILNFRYSVFDPDTLFNWLEPQVRFVWTRGFLLLSLVTIGLAGMVAWQNHTQLTADLTRNLRWETAVMIWLTIVAVTLLHEFAHGLTCKHYGGEVHELGVLVMFFTPCFYCNVSDAWIIPERWKRLLITAAGAYLDLCLWAVGVFVWRVTLPGSPVNFLAWVIITVCGTRTLFNFNPLMKLDGYYLLSDWCQVPNLRKQAREYRTAWLRWFLWGAQRPAAVASGRLLLIYGLITWTFSVVFLDAMLLGLFKFLGARWGWVGILGASWLAYMVLTRLFRGLFAGEVIKMLKNRKLRTATWGVGLAAVAAAMIGLSFENRSSGNFQVRPAQRVEVRAMVAGFLREVNCEEGDKINAGATLVRLEIPDLESQITQKYAQITESQANLKKLLAGPRKEEVREARLKVERVKAWRDLAEQDLHRAKLSLNEELVRLEGQIAQFQAEHSYSLQSLAQAKMLYERGAMAGQQYLAEKKKADIAQLQLDQVRAQKRAREAVGTTDSGAALAGRTKELADTEMALKLLEVGTRPEEIDAEKARLARLEEELKFLTDTRAKLAVNSPIKGLITTARMKEKIGQYLEKGALICVVEDSTGLEAEIALAEQDVTGVEPGQDVELKARALPFRTFLATVERVAPRANTVEGAPQGTITVYCRLHHGDEDLLAGMTGMGRIFRGKESLGNIACERAVRYFRTEFWW
ncbi:MAG: efflux RND transporter periplasmic adaptor subunit [Planctomycetes bacterium]|nr:efflux RND transporter periplasmic adaptor subunit [Planctomycetota bacterium]